MKKVIKYLSIFFLVLCIVSLGAGLYMVNYALELNHRGQNIEESYAEMYDRYPYLESWVDSLHQKEALKDTFLINNDGKRLHGLYINAAEPTSKTAVIVHGYTDNSIRMLMIGYLYNKDLDYNVLLPDLQYHGKSEGSAIQMGWKDRLDVKQWIDMAINMYEDSTQLVVHGISMGAATTMMLSAEELPNQVKAFIEDCGYTSVWDEFNQEISVQFGLPAFPILHVASFITDLKYDWNFREASALNAVSKSKYPMFFIHGDADTFVPTWMVYPLYEAKQEPKELWIVPGVEHARAYHDYKEEYTEKVNAFVSKYIK